MSRAVTACSIPRRTILTCAAATVSATLFRFWQPVAAQWHKEFRIGGTGMALAAVRRIGRAYMLTRTDVAIEVLPSLGTGGGLAAVAAGAIDLALSSRALTDAENAKNLHGLAYARTPMAFVAHPSAGIDTITSEDIAEILLGRRLTWPNGLAIRLIRREPSDGAWSVLRAVSGDISAAAQTALERPGLLTAMTDQENADYLERLPGSFGMMSIGQLRAESRGVVPLILDGNSPTVEALASGHYKLSMTLYFVWRGQPDPDITQFLTFAAAAQTNDLLTRLGHIPLAGTGT